MVMQLKRSSTPGATPGGSAGETAVTYGGINYNSGGGPAYTYSNIDVGTASADRVLVCCFIQEQPTKILINNANLETSTAMTAICNSYGGGGRGVDMYYVSCPTGTTANVTVTYASTLARHGFSWWTVTGANTSGISSFTNNTAGTGLPLDLSKTVTTGSVLIGAVGSNATSGGSPYTWTADEAMTEDYDAQDPNSAYRLTGAHDIVGTGGSWSITVDCTNTSSTAFYGGAIVELPAVPAEGTPSWAEGYLALNLGDGKIYSANANLTVNTFPVGTHASINTFSTSGTWTKPGHGTTALVWCWGAGGSGAYRAGSANGAGGGGGGGFAWGIFPLSELGATETITIGTGGAAKTSDGPGDSGGSSSFGSWLVAYGGCGGSNVVTSGICPGGHGGGFETAASGGTNAARPTRNYFAIGNTGVGATVSVGANGGVSGFGGGGGAANGGTTYAAGDTAGGGGGGGGAGRTTANPVNAGGVAYQHEFAQGANGGAGGNNSTAGSGGSYPGGGGGGGVATSSGAGANGYIAVVIL